VTDPARHPDHPPGWLVRAIAQVAEVTGLGNHPDPDEAVMAARAKRWTGRAIAVATLFLALLNAHSIQTWATTLPPNWTSETLRVLGDAWAGRVADLGLDRPREAIRDAYEKQKTLGWDGKYHPEDKSPS
jgi:hypothetical protein